MSNEPSVAKRCGIAVEHEQAAAVSGEGNDLARTAFAVKVASKRTARGERVASARAC
jgi:hypothetical protein